MANVNLLCETHCPHLNLDPLDRLIGEANETSVIIQGKEQTALIDSGAVISQITMSLTQELELVVKELRTILPLEGCAGIKVPYLGYVEAKLEIPGMPSFSEDCLFLVLPDHTYGYRVPVTIGTLHIDMIMEQATSEELQEMSVVWGRGQLFKKLRSKKAQIEGYLAYCENTCKTCCPEVASNSSDDEMLIA